MRRQITLGLTLVVALALAGPAAAKSYKDTDGGTITVTGSVQPTDKNGKPTGPKKELTGDAIDVDAPQIGTSARVAALAASQGCANVSGTIKKDSLFGFRIWQFWHYASFCWNYPNVVSVTRSTDGKGSNGWSYDGVVSSTSPTWYTWCCGAPHSGHRRQFRGGFHIPAGPVQQTAYPYLRLDLQGNGLAYVISGT